MRKLLLLATSFATLAAATALPAGAVTPASFTLTAGALAITSPTSSVSLGTQGASNSSSTISGSIGVVTVSDERGGPTTWTASVIASAFTPAAGPADPASNVSYSAGPITASALVVALPVAAPNLTGVSPVVPARAPESAPLAGTRPSQCSCPRTLRPASTQPRSPAPSPNQCANEAYADA